ncbi:MAG: hypothetical protein AB4911_06615 [Oscillochloridaceae bacterium umkhey_bin13]
MSRLATALFALIALLLTACGEYVPPTPTRSATEDRQTAVALGGRPTLAPLPPRPTATPGPPVTDLLQISADDPRAMGDPNAPVLIIEFTDFE